MKLRHIILGIALAGFVFPMTASAATPLSASADAALRKDIVHARGTDAGSFANVNGILSKAAEAHGNARSHKAPIAQSLARLGPAATLPILELLAVDPPKGIPEAMKPVVRRDLIEAVGLLKDARAIPVLGSILADAGEDTDTTRTTSEAIARVGTAEAATMLVTTLSAATGDRARALALGMGECRRLEITQALVARLRGAGMDNDMVLATARALGRNGNAWAWKTLADRSGEEPIRNTAATALVDAFVARPDARTALSNALMVIDAPVTPALIASARAKASESSVTVALDALSTRLASNPAR